MWRSLTFFGITLLSIIGLYNAHLILSYIYYNYCSGFATGTPPCLYLLELIYISVNGIKSFWIYLGTLATGLFLYAFNRLFSEITNINSKLNQSDVEITKHRLFK
jgi:hypothetical protein